MEVMGSLGTGIGSESPLVIVTRAYKPEKVYVVLSVDSSGRLEDFREQVKDMDTEIVPIFVDPEDPSDIYRKIRDLDVDVVDITSGTKVMAAVLFYYAVKGRRKITYVSGFRNKSTGRVLTGTEVVKELDCSGLD